MYTSILHWSFQICSQIHPKSFDAGLIVYACSKCVFECRRHHVVQQPVQGIMKTKIIAHVIVIYINTLCRYQFTENRLSIHAAQKLVIVGNHLSPFGCQTINSFKLWLPEFRYFEQASSYRYLLRRLKMANDSWTHDAMEYNNAPAIDFNNGWVPFHYQDCLSGVCYFHFEDKTVV